MVLTISDEDYMWMRVTLLDQDRDNAIFIRP